MGTAKGRVAKPAVSTSKMDALAEQLRLNDCVTIWLPGTTPQSVQIQKVVLANVSSWFHEKIKKLETTSTRGKIVMDFPYDDTGAWKVLFFWIVMKRLPPKDPVNNVLLARSWVVGEKYDIVDFQDEVMVALLFSCDNETAEMEEIKVAFLTARTGSKLRELMAEELLDKVDDSGENPDDLHLGDFENRAPGLATAILKAYQRYAEGDDDFWKRFKKREGGMLGRWRDFMVGDGLKVQGTVAALEAGLDKAVI